MMKYSARYSYAFLLVLCASMLISGCSGDSPSGSSDRTIGAIISSNTDAISAEELSQHLDEADCWVVYGGGVYDITGFIQSYDGDDLSKVSQYCGTTTPMETVVDSLNMDFTDIESRSVYIGELDG